MELLVVMAIMGVLLGLVGIAFSNLGRSGALNKSASDIAGILEMARAQAMSQNTHVWVGFKNLQEGNVDSVLVGVVGSKNGTSDEDGDVVQLGRIRRFENLQIVSGLPNETDTGAERPAVSSGNYLLDGESTRSFSVGSGTNKVDFDPADDDTAVIQFNSRGEARMGDTLRRIIEIGLQTSIGDKIINEENFAAIQVGGLTGSVSLYRP